MFTDWLTAILLPLLFQSVPFLAHAPAYKIEYLCPMFRYRPLRAGETLFEQGSLGTAMYVVLDGRMQVKMEHENKEVCVFVVSHFSLSLSLISMLFTLDV